MAAGTPTVGARLLIGGSAAAIRNLQAFNAELERTNELLVTTKKASEDAAIATGGVVGAKEDKAAASGEGAGAEEREAAAIGATTAAATKAKTAVDDLEKSHSNLNSTLNKAGAGALGTFGEWAGAAALGIAIESVKQYSDLQNQYIKLFTLAGKKQSQVPAIMQGGIQISKETGVNFSDVANQLYRIASANAGLKETNSQLLSLGKQAANLAVLFNTPTGSSSELIGRLFGNLSFAGKKNSQGSQLQGVGNAAHITQLLAATVGAGDMQPSDLVGALSKGLVSSGQAVGAKLPDLLSWIALSTKLGQNASTTGTLISHSLQQVATPSEQGTKAQLMFGIQQGQLHSIISNQGVGPAVGKLIGSMLGGLNTPSYYPAFGTNAPGSASAIAQLQAWGLSPQVIQQMQTGFGLTASQQAYVQKTGQFAPGETKAQIAEQKNMLQLMATKMFGGARQELPYLTIAENQQAYKTTEAYIMKNTNPKQYQAELNAAMNAPSRQFKIAEKNIEALGLQLGKDLTPAALDGVHAFVDMLKWFTSHKGVFMAVATLAGELAAFGLLAKAYSKLSGPVGKVVGYTKGRYNAFTGKIAPATGGTTEEVAAKTQATAAEMQLDAARLQVEAAGGGDARAAEGLAGGRWGGLGKRYGAAGEITGAAEGAEGAAAGAGLAGAEAGVETAGLSFSALAGPIGIAAAMAAPIAMPYIIKGLSGLGHLLFGNSAPLRYQTSAALLKQQITSDTNTISQVTKTIYGNKSNQKNPGVQLQPTDPHYVGDVEHLAAVTAQKQKAKYYAGIIATNPAIQVPAEERQLKSLQAFIARYKHEPGLSAPQRNEARQIQDTITRQLSAAKAGKAYGVHGSATTGPAWNQFLEAAKRGTGDQKAASDSLKAAADKTTSVQDKTALGAADLKTAAGDAKQANLQTLLAAKSTGLAAADHKAAAKALNQAALTLQEAGNAIKGGVASLPAQAAALAQTAVRNANARG